MIDLPIKNITMKQCCARCDRHKKCKFFFFTDECMRAQTPPGRNPNPRVAPTGGQCPRRIKPGNMKSEVCQKACGTGRVRKANEGCCAMFTNCLKFSPISNSGHTCIKGEITLIYPYGCFYYNTSFLTSEMP